MRLHYRILEGDAHRDMRLDVSDDATIGDVAHAITATRPATGTAPLDGSALTLVAEPGGGPVPLASALAIEAAPASGSTIRVTAATTATPAPQRWSPVELRGMDGRTATTRLPYGSTALGPTRIQVGSTVTVHATGDPGRTEVDGVRVLGASAVDHGSLLRVGTTTFGVHIDGPLRPPCDGPWRHHLSAPAVVEHHEAVVVDLPTPPGAERLPGFPLLSAVVPLLMGAAMWAATRSVMVAGFTLFSVAFVVASGIEVRREHRRDRRFRERSFRTELAETAERARSLHRDEIRRACRDLPAGAEVASWVVEDDRRVWERRPTQPSLLRVRIGTERTSPVDRVRIPVGGRADLRSELLGVAEGLSEIERPTGVDLGVSGLGIAGAGDGATALARSVLAQLAATLGPDHLSIVADVSVDRAACWRWLHWLPHDVLLGASPAPAPAPASATSNRHDHATITIVDRADRSTQALSASTDHVIVVGGSEADLPDGLGTTVVVDGPRCTVRRNDGPATPLSPEGLSIDACEDLARGLASLRPPEGGSSAIPEVVTLQDVIADPELLSSDDVLRQTWERSRVDRSTLRAPVGRSAGGVIHVDLRADGPHGLVAGTTGSGKSELLRTLVVSLALHHPPDRVSFLLVDYKGGATFRSVAELPHVVGVVSDLGPTGARRAITSLRAEIRRREHLVAETDGTDLDCLGDSAPPALVVVVDEFATLAHELPDVLGDLLDVAQRGRSLGIHLLLSTQRPSGVVTDAVRANLSMRFALRVADEDDSRDVVDGPEAAHLPTDAAGRAFLRLGPTERLQLQVADSGAAHRHRARASCVPLAGPPAEATELAGPVQLDVAVSRCRSAATGIDRPRRPWVEPLPVRVDALALRAPLRPGGLVIGMLDRPSQQCRSTAEFDLGERGGLLVLGAGRSGRTSALGAVARAAVADRRRPTIVYGIDSGRGLGSLVGMIGAGGHLADVVASDDAERVLRLLRTLRPGAGERRSDRVVVLLDGVGNFVEHHEHVNRGEANDLLRSIALDGPSDGVHLVAAARRLAEIPVALANALEGRLLLRCATPDDAAALGGPAELADVGLPPGRGVLDGDAIQVTAPPACAADVDPTPSMREAIGRLPTSVLLRALPSPVGWRIPVGTAAEDLQTAVLDLTHHNALVIGPPRTGRTTALDTIAAQFARTDPPHEIRRVRHEDTDDAITSLESSLRPPLHGRRLVIIDDLTDLLDSTDGAVIDAILVRLLAAATASEVRVVASAEADAVTRCYGDSLRRLRSGRSGILLRPDPDLHPGLLHTALPRHDELPPAAGRGWIVTPDAARAVQLAR